MQGRGRDSIPHIASSTTKGLTISQPRLADDVEVDVMRECDPPPFRNSWVALDDWCDVPAKIRVTADDDPVLTMLTHTVLSLQRLAFQLYDVTDVHTGVEGFEPSRGGFGDRTALPAHTPKLS